jgi:hypothetical protein
LVSGFGLRVSDFWFLVSGFGSRVSGFRFPVSGCGGDLEREGGRALLLLLLLRDLLLRESIHEFRVAGLGSRVSGLGSRVSVLGVRGSGFGGEDLEREGGRALLLLLLRDLLLR